MPTKARDSFDESAKEVDRLLGIHTEIGGDTPGRKYDLEVLNKSGIVLITAIWEGFCEDLASEGLDHIVTHATKPDQLPKELRKRIARELREDKNDLAVWDLAATGWKKYLKLRGQKLTEERNRRLNTPRTSNIDDFFQRTLGIDNVSSSWYWQGLSKAMAKKKLDDFVTLRGAIAHRGKASHSCKKSHVKKYLNHVRGLVLCTEPKVVSHVEKVSGKSW